jgi:multidrug efflux pump subunit AcrA (membrane-fusion protein)
MPVEIDVPNPKGLLRPGMYGSVIIHLKGSPDAVMVPVQCVFGHFQETVVIDRISIAVNKVVVYIVRDGKAHRTVVTVGQERGGKVEIFAGLKPSDRVVMDIKSLFPNVQPAEVDVVPVEVKDAP